MGIIFFLDNYFSILGAGVSNRKIADENKMSREMFAFEINSVACCTAVFKNAKARKHPVLLGGTLLLTILIIMATVFLKQHTLVDVVAAFALNVFCYQMFYKEHPARQKQPAFVK